MSFGFSVGDFITAASLIEQTICALREASGSSSQYRRLTLELHALGRTLKEVDRLEAVHDLEATVEAIKATALSCQLPLREFLSSINEYDGSLALGRTSGIMKDVLHKVKWIASKKQEAALHLQAQMAAYFGGINLLLGLYQVKLNAIVEQKARRRFQSLHIALANMQLQTQMVVGDVAGLRQQIVEETSMVRNEIEKSSKETSQAVQSVQRRCISTIQFLAKKTGTFSQVTFQTYHKVSEIYKLLSSVQSTLDTRHTWFQAPMRLEDAYGRVWPIPVEYDYSMVEGALRGKFLHGRGSKFVEEDQWQLFDPSSPHTIFTHKNWEPFPGRNITMAMILQSVHYKMLCPRLDCPGETYTDAVGGGKNCTVCGAWFESICEFPGYIEEFNDDDDGHEEDEEEDSDDRLVTDPDSGDESTEERIYYTLVPLDDFRLLKNTKLRPIGTDTEAIEYEMFYWLRLSPKTLPKNRKVLEESATD